MRLNPTAISGDYMPRACYAVQRDIGVHTTEQQVDHSLPKGWLNM